MDTTYFFVFSMCMYVSHVHTGAVALMFKMLACDRKEKTWSNWGQYGRECGRVLPLNHSEGALEPPPIGPNWTTGAAQCPAVERRRQLKIYLTV